MSNLIQTNNKENGVVKVVGENTVTIFVFGLELE